MRCTFGKYRGSGNVGRAAETGTVFHLFKPGTVPALKQRKHVL